MQRPYLCVMRWHWEERGEGRPLVLLHGIGSACAIWEPVMEPLSRHRRVVAFDLPGFGKTPCVPEGMPPTPASFAELLPEALAEAGIEGPVDIVGNSLGGWTALEAAKRGLARTVVGLSPAGLWPNGAHPEWPRLVLIAAYRGARTMTPLSRRLLRTAAGRKAFMSTMYAHPERIPGDLAIEMSETMASGPGFRDTLAAVRGEAFTGGAAIDVPVTVAFGTRDRLLTARSCQHRDELPRTHRWLKLPDCGHVPMWDNPVLVTQVILLYTREGAQVSGRTVGGRPLEVSRPRT